VPEQSPDLSRRNLRSALLLGALALGFLLMFIWAVSHR